MVSKEKAAKRRRYLRPLISFAGLAFASLALTGCIQLEGDLEIGPDARASGKLLYSIDKSLAELAGIKSLSDLRSSPDQVKATDSCKGTRLYEAPSDYVIDCSITNAVLADEAFNSKVVDGKVVFTYKSTGEDNSSGVEFGLTDLRVKFPGAIDRIDSSNPKLVTKIDSRTIAIKGLATDSYDITVYASCKRVCSNSTSSIGSGTEDINHPGYVKASKRIGGMLTQNTVFTRDKSPYTITKTLQIPQGITLKVEPGVTLVSKADTMFQVQGDLLLEGDASGSINLNGRPKIFFLTKNAPVGARIKLNYVNLNGGQLISTNSGHSGYVNWELKNSRILGVTKRWHVWYPTNFIVEQSVFKNSGGIDLGITLGGEKSGEAIIRNNLFDGPSRSGFWIQSWNSRGGALRVVGNHFKGDGFNVMKVKYDSSFIDASENYWGTTDSRRIENRVLDAADSIKYKSKIDVSKPLINLPLEVPRR
jgi:hypothetical protein